MKASGRPALSAFRRAYSAQAQAARSADKGALGKAETRLTKLPSGAVVASIENNSPVSKVAVVYNAGSRFETGNQSGITHCIRSAVNLSAEKATGFSITRNVQQIGGSLSCTSTREHMFYTLDCLRSELDTGVEFLAYAASAPAFRPWELSDAASRMNLDLDLLAQNPHTQLVEALHAAAFRGGLGKSLYANTNKVGYFNSSVLQAFTSQHFSAANMAVVGLGVDHDQLLAYAKQIKPVGTASPAASPSPYHGGTVHIEMNSPFVHAAVVTEGVGLGSKDLNTMFVLQKVMGSGPSIKYSSNMTNSKVSKAASQGTAQPFAASCVVAPYSDSGLFGFQVIAQAGDADKVIKSVAASFAESTKGGITDADVKRAKTQLKACYLMELENADNVLQDTAVQALLSHQVLSTADIMADIDKITTADVQTLAKKIINGKPSMAAVGDVSNTPYADQLF